MNKPALYHKAHHEVKQDVGRLIAKFATKLQWRPEGGDTVIDIGTGPGDVTMKYIYPLIPSNYGKVVFSDISLAMLDFFKSHYEIPNKCALKLLDIETQQPLPADMMGKFDHLISSLVLHWVPGNRTALKNMFNLLRPEGGDCILVFFSYNSVFQANHMLNCDPKWSKYVENVDRFVAPLQFRQNPTNELRDMMKAAGFSNISMDVKQATYHYKNMEEFRESLITVCGIYDFIPECRQSEFLDGYVEAFEKVAMERRNLSGEESKCVVVADIIVAYGQKMPIAIPFN
ncbi:juvenile hormone acid O-methyltransferase-like [Musca domestica]|uniref:Juvenile hormone acid O-methyltransferase-like n=1 Tax=Musca domestica TaxID=7370 RepID=A0A1I8MH96_MUSDO|nr:juvenile hormone acid O-methyltransferase-like [Musca domestica]